MNRLWKNISYAGIHTALNEDKRRKIILCNRMGFVAFLIIFKSMIIFFKIPTLFTISLFTGLLYLSCVLWNSLRFYGAARLIMMIVPPAGIILNAGFMTDGPANSSKFLFIGIIVIPLILYQLSEAWKMSIGICWIILTFIVFDPLTALIPRHPEIINDSILDNTFISAMNGIISFLMIILAFIHFQFLDRRQIEKLRLQVDHLQKTSAQQIIDKEIKEQELQSLDYLYTELNNRNKSLSSQALRAQIDPHFIFNAMNSIQNFIFNRDTTSAISYVSKFSKLMRQTLEGSTMEKISIEEELALLKNYLDLEKLRFNNAFDYVFETDENIDAAYTEIPSMLLQPYAENAVLHGLRHKKENGLLRIIFLYQFDNILCIIEDNGIGRVASTGINNRRENHHSKGSSVTANRLALLSKDGQAGARILYLDLKDEAGNPAGTRVEITIPLAY